MTKQILKQIWNERRSNAWLWVELLLVSVVLWIVVDWCYVMIHTYMLPKGFDIENTYLLNFGVLNSKSERYIPAESKTTTVGEDILELMDRLRHRPDVEAVSMSYNSYPYNGSNSYNGLKHDTIKVTRHRRSVTPEFFNVFKYQNVDGSGSQSLVNAFEENTIIVPSNFWPDEYVGKELKGLEFVYMHDTTRVVRVAAITNPVKYADFRNYSSSAFYVQFVSEKEIASINDTSVDFIEFCLRVRPGTSSDFAEQLMKESSRNYIVGNCFIKGIDSFDNVRKMFHKDDMKEMKTRGYIMFFLLANIFLGIIGTFWFRTQQRRSEMGLRIALGSSAPQLKRILILEGLYLLAAAFIPAMIICYNIGYMDITQAWQIEWGLARFIPGILITLFLLVMMIIVGIWYPARQAMKIEPSEALRDE